MLIFRRSFLFIFALGTQTSCERNALAQSLVNLIAQDFVPKVGIFNFYIKCLEEPNRISYFSELADATLQRLENISVRFGIQQKLPTDSQRHFCVLAVDSSEAVQFLFNDIGSGHFNIDGYVIIVLKTFHQHFYETMVHIFEANWKTGVVDVNVLVEPIPGDILMFTSFPFSIYSCKSVFPAIFNRFVNSKWESDILFPGKLKNMHGCPIICATWEDEPYFKILRDSNDHEIYMGIEGKLLEFIATRINFSVHLYIMNDEEIDATLQEKGLIFDKLFRNGVDFVMGALHYKPTSKDDFFMPSGVYYLSTICIVMNSIRNQFSPIRKLLFPFTPWLWLYVAIVFGIGILVILITRRLTQDKRDFILGSMNRIPVYNMFYIALGGGITIMPRRNFARFLFCIWMFLWLVLRSGYQSALFHFIRMDLSTRSPDSIEDVMKENYEILLTPSVYNTLQYLPSIQKASQFLNGTEIENFPMVLDVGKKIAILTPYEYFGFFKTRNKKRIGDFHLATETVFTQQLSIYLKKNSLLNSEINKAILQYSSRGLGERWERILFDKRVKESKLESEQAKSMTIEEVYGAVDVYICGMFVSLVVVGAEICINKISRHFTRGFNKIRQRLKI